MATLQDIITAAFRESGIIAVGNTPATSENTEALTLLINLIGSVYTDEVGEFLVPYVVGSNGITYGPDASQIVTDKIPQNSRLHCNLSAATKLYLPVVPHDGAIIAVTDMASNFATFPLTLDGNGKKISGANTLVLNTSNFSMSYIYNNSTGNWTPINPLTAATDTFPFSDTYTDLFAIGLAMRLNPRYGATTAPESVDAYKRLLRKFRTQYKHSQVAALDLALTTLSENSGTTTNFSRGY